jgi:hypothetical protein
MKLETYRQIAPPAKDRMRASKRPGLLWPLLGLLALLSGGGFVGGLSFVRDRTGADLGAKLSWLQETPVNDFFLPGLFLLGVYGIGSLLLMTGLAWRWSPRPLRRLNAGLGHHWAWVGAIGQGAALVTWILYEFVVLPDQMLLQPILIGVGLLMVVLALMPSMRRFYATGAAGISMEGGELRGIDARS